MDKIKRSKRWLESIQSFWPRFFLTFPNRSPVWWFQRWHPDSAAWKCSGAKLNIRRHSPSFGAVPPWSGECFCPVWRTFSLIVECWTPSYAMIEADSGLLHGIPLSGTNAGLQNLPWHQSACLCVNELHTLWQLFLLLVAAGQLAFTVPLSLTYLYVSSDTLANRLSE